jgi:hypothetical protein
MLIIINFNSFGQEEKIYTDVDVKAMYKGKNVEEIGSDVQKNQVYPKSAKEQKISAKIYVQFIIDENGKVADIEIVRTNIMDNSGINILVKDYKPGSNSKIDAKSVADLEAEAIRAVKCLDGFTPAQKDGKKVRTQFITSVCFFYDLLN